MHVEFIMVNWIIFTEYNLEKDTRLDFELYIIDFSIKSLFWSDN